MPSTKSSHIWKYISRTNAEQLIKVHIDRWFHELPLYNTSGFAQMLEWDKNINDLIETVAQILVEPHPDRPLHNEIVRWLNKLSFLPGQHVLTNEFAVELEKRLKDIEEDLKPKQKLMTNQRHQVTMTNIKNSVHADNISPNNNYTFKRIVKGKDKTFNPYRKPLPAIDEDTSANDNSQTKNPKLILCRDKASMTNNTINDSHMQKKTPSIKTFDSIGANTSIIKNANQDTTQALKQIDVENQYPNSCVHIYKLGQKRQSDIIKKTVWDWCVRIPMPQRIANKNSHLIKHELAEKLLDKIFAMNSDPDILNDGTLYNILLDAFLEKYFSELPAFELLEANKEAIKQQLKESLKDIKPLPFDKKLSILHKCHNNSSNILICDNSDGPASITESSVVNKKHHSKTEPPLVSCIALGRAKPTNNGEFMSLDAESRMGTFSENNSSPQNNYFAPETNPLAGPTRNPMKPACCTIQQPQQRVPFSELTNTSIPLDNHPGPLSQSELSAELQRRQNPGYGDPYIYNTNRSYPTPDYLSFAEGVVSHSSRMPGLVPVYGNMLPQYPIYCIPPPQAIPYSYTADPTMSQFMPFSPPLQPAMVYQLPVGNQPDDIQFYTMADSNPKQYESQRQDTWNASPFPPPQRQQPVFYDNTNPVLQSLPIDIGRRGPPQYSNVQGNNYSLPNQQAERFPNPHENHHGIDRFIKREIINRETLRRGRVNAYVPQGSQRESDDSSSVQYVMRDEGQAISIHSSGNIPQRPQPPRRDNLQKPVSTQKTSPVIRISRGQQSSSDDYPEWEDKDLSNSTGPVSRRISAITTNAQIHEPPKSRNAERSLRRSSSARSFAQSRESFPQNREPFSQNREQREFVRKHQGLNRNETFARDDRHLNASQKNDPKMPQNNFVMSPMFANRGNDPVEQNQNEPWPPDTKKGQRNMKPRPGECLCLPASPYGRMRCPRIKCLDFYDGIDELLHELAHRRRYCGP